MLMDNFIYVLIIVLFCLESLACFYLGAKTAKGETIVEYKGSSATLTEPPEYVGGEYEEETDE